MSGHTDDVRELLHPFFGDVTFENLPQTANISLHRTSDASIIHLTSHSDLEIPTNTYDKPHFYLAMRPQTSPHASSLQLLAFQASEFALPIRAGASLDFDFFNRPKFTRPHTVMPVIAYLPVDSTDTKCAFLAPINHFHEHVIAVNSHLQQLQWGPNGDLELLPKGTTLSLAVIHADNIPKAFQIWAHMLRSNAKRSGSINVSKRYTDVSMSHLSYWTDNGAAYWYRTEPQMDLPATLQRTLNALKDAHVPIGAVELDSWFYRHEITREITSVDYPHVVPPTGMIRWEPRPDALPNGMFHLRKQLSNLPLILHSRHISSKSTYINHPHFGDKWYIHEGRAHPVDDTLFQTWMRDASDWGAVTYEQDWIDEVWLGVVQLRRRMGRIARWQRQLNDAAADNALSLIWCMATPADMALAVSLPQIISVRSCDDYRYAADPAILWRWHLTTSRMLRALCLWPYKDVFMSHDNGMSKVDINGDPQALLEACLATLSAGPVGIGDRMNKTDPTVIACCCRKDGVIVKPDLPLAAVDVSLRSVDRHLWAETRSSAWHYVMAINARTESYTAKNGHYREPSNEVMGINNDTGSVIYDWKSKLAVPGTAVSAYLARHEWKLFVVCPQFTNSSESLTHTYTILGDAGKFATMGDRRIRLHKHVLEQLAHVKDLQLEPHSELSSNETSWKKAIEIGEKGLTFDVIGAPDEEVFVSYWSSQRGLQESSVIIPRRGWRHAVVRYYTEIDAVELRFDIDNE